LSGGAFFEVIRCGNVADRGGDVVDGDVDGLGGDAAVVIEDFEFDWIVAVVGEGVIDSAKLTLRERPSFNWCGCAVNIPAVGEGVVTDVGGGGGEGGDGSFFNVGGDVDSLNRGWEVINCQVDGGEVGDLSVGAIAEVGEAVVPNVGGIRGVGVGEVPSWEG
jgi:hypothetical protein